MARAKGVCSTSGCWQLRPCPTHVVKAWANSDRRSRLPKDWHKIRAQIMTRDQGRCQHCGAPANQVDHIRRGSDHSLGNLQALCEPCHRAKTIAERR